MSVSNTAGKTYDVAEYGRINSVLNEQQDIMDEIDKENGWKYGLILCRKQGTTR